MILVVAASFRYYGLAWDSGYLFHPDERKILLVASELHLPENPVEFFSPDSPINPKFFAYGSFPIYLVRILGAFAPAVSYAVPWREDLVSLALLGRALSALFDLGTIVLLFLLARRLYSATVGLIAAGFIASTVLHVQLSHFYTVDTLLTLLIVATMFFAARFAETGTRRDAAMMGSAFGLALATKISAAPLIVPILIAVMRAHSGTNSTKSRLLGKIWDARRPLAGIVGIALAAFIVTQPYAVLDPFRYLGQVGTESLVARGWLDYPYTRQYANTLPFLYPIAQSSVWGMGLPLGIFAWAGSALFIWQSWRAREWRAGFILSWALVYFLFVGVQYTKYLRYLLPLLPFLFLMAAAYFAPFVARNAPSILRFTSRALVLFVALSSFAYALAFDSLYAREHPWLQISRWIYQNVPGNSTIALEHWDDALPVPMRGSDAAGTPDAYRTRILEMYDTDDAAKVQKVIETLASSDYIILASPRLAATISRLPARYPIASRYYALLFKGQLGFDLVAFARNDPALDGITIADDPYDGTAPAALYETHGWLWTWGRADESFTVYDHPIALVFKKARPLSGDALRSMLSP